MKSCDDDQENHESMNVEKMKKDIKTEFAKVCEDVNENVTSLMQKMEKNLKKIFKHKRSIRCILITTNLF